MHYNGFMDISNDGYIAITAHYVNGETSKLCWVMLGCIEFHEKSLQQNIAHIITAVVSDNAANMRGAVRLPGCRSTSCFTHTLNLVVQANIAKISSKFGKVKVQQNISVGGTKKNESSANKTEAGRSSALKLHLQYVGENADDEECRHCNYCPRQDSPRSFSCRLVIIEKAVYILQSNGKLKFKVIIYCRIMEKHI